MSFAYKLVAFYIAQQNRAFRVPNGCANWPCVYVDVLENISFTNQSFVAAELCLSIDTDAQNVRAS